MILSRFLPNKTKIQSPDPETRQQGVQELDSTDPQLAEIAQQDTDANVRCAAIARLNDWALLQQMASQEADAQVRIAAEARYLHLLCGKAADGPTLADRLAHLVDVLRTEWIEHLLHHAVEPALRLALCDRFTAEADFIRIAMDNSHPDVRLAAVERVHDPKALEDIAKHNRQRDKRLFRRVRERLDQQTSQQAAATLQEQLCLEMEQLEWDGESGHNAGRFPKLEHEWRAHEATASPEQRTRYEEARNRFLEEHQASAQRRAQRVTLATAVNDLLERLRKATETNAETKAAVVHATEEVPTLWAALGPVQDAEMRKLEERLNTQLDAIREQERVLQANAKRAARCRDILRQAENLIKQAGELKENDFKPVRQRWEGLEQPTARELVQQLQRQFDSVFDQFRARLQRQAKQAEQEWEEIQATTTRLEQAVAEGLLQEAMTLQEQAREQLNTNIGLTRAQMTQIEERFQACTGQVTQLRDWRRWGAQQAREQLCVAAEALIGLEEDPTTIAQRIQQAREEWKKLDHQESAAPKGLWKRFHQACERAYEPCQAFFEAQNRERVQNMEKKEAVCAQLEAFEADTDWQKVDWREADKYRRKAQNEWLKIGPVNRADRKQIDKRQQAVWKKLDARFASERDREIARREALIKEVKSLDEGMKVRTAIDIVKRAQASWHPTVQAAQRQEQALWKEFRAACDAVFARREAEQQALDADRHGSLAQKQALCAEVESLCEAAHLDHWMQSRGRVNAIRQAWEAAGPVPRAEQRGMEQRFETALRHFAARENVLRQAKVREQFQSLHERSRHCARLEALLLEPISSAQLETVSEVQATWSTLPALPSAWQTAIQKRLSTIVRALEEASITERNRLRDQLLANVGEKRLLCVCMEIAAGIESPAADAQLRMEHQVARLAASLAGTTAKTTHALYNPVTLQERWCAIGALPPQDEEALDARFLRALQAWWKKEAGG